MKMIRLFIRKIICLVLSFIFLITGSPISFAQKITKKIKYMPAFSFKYEFFSIYDGGKIIPGTGKYKEKVIEVNKKLKPIEEFIAKLKADMDDNTEEEVVEPKSLESQYIPRTMGDGVDRVDAFSYRNMPLSQYSSRVILYKPVQKAYNDFMYYSAYPTESPYWKWTALVPDNEASEDDVLLILLKHKQLTEEILKLFKENPRYKMERSSKLVLVTMGTVLLALESWILWEIAPLLPVSKWISMPVLLGLDILSSDYLAYNLRNLEETKRYLDDIDIQLATFTNMKKRNMFKSQVESNKIGICKTAEENAKNLKEAYIATNGNYKIGQEMAKWERISAFCEENKPIFGYKDARLEIGEYLNEEYKKLSYSKERINYIRKEMLHIYYALLFIKEELKDKSDKLRFDRALIDIATTYKVAYVTFTDGRIVSWNKPPEFVSQIDLFINKGLDKKDFITEFVTEEGEVMEEYTPLAGDVLEKVMPHRSYPSLLNRAQLNYIVQRIDIQRQIDDKAADEKMEKFWNEQYEQNRWQGFK